MYTFQVKKALSYLVLSALVGQIASPILAFQKADFRPESAVSFAWKLTPLFGLIAGAIGWKTYRYKREKVFKETREQLPKELQNLVGEYAMPHAFKRDVIKLLPVILCIPKVVFGSVLEHSFKMHGEKLEALRNADELAPLREHINDLNDRAVSKHSIALYATIVSSNDSAAIDANYTQHIDLMQRQQQDPHGLLIKDETPLHEILGQPLLSGQIALVSYSDGDIRIEMTESDRQILDNLSEEQIKFLDSLYSTVRALDRGFPTILLSTSEYWKFYRLFDKGPRSYIQKFYNIRFDHMRLEDLICAAGAGFMVGLLVWAISNMRNRNGYWKLWSQNWDIGYENYVLKNHLKAQNISLPYGVSPRTKIGHITFNS